MPTWKPRYTGRAVQLLVLIGFGIYLCCNLGLLDFTSRRFDTWAWESCSVPASSFHQSCSAKRHAIATEVQIVVKTGGSEPRTRLRSTLSSLLFEVPHQNIVIYSDLAEEIDTHRVYDVYADIPATERLQYPEFALYDQQLANQKLGQDAQRLQGGWDLSKYMNLAMTRKLWTMRSEFGEKKWFIFIETDTFIEWDNLLELLTRFDPTDPIYLGSPVWLPGLEFAHGGTAYVMSYAALEVLNEPNNLRDAPLHYSQYGLNTTALCCGDEAIARVLKQVGVRLKGFWPMFNGEVPSTVAFGEEVWCEPVISLHHLSGQGLNEFVDWTQQVRKKRKGSNPFLFEDLFKFVGPQLRRTANDWDNMESGTTITPKTKAAHKSFEGCEAACVADRQCLQFAYDGEACALAHYFRIGCERLPEHGNEHEYRSGWQLERIRRWTTQHKCTSAHWVRANP